MAARSEPVLPEPSPRTLLGAYLAAGVAILIWSGTPAATRLAVLDMDPLAAAIMRTVLAAAVAVPLLLLLPGRQRPVGQRQWGVLAATAVTGFIGFTILFSLGTQLTSAAHAALINASIPLFAGLFGVLAERRAPHARWFVGMALSFIGVMALITVRGPDGDGASLVGDLLCLASSVVAAIGYVTGSQLAKSIGTVSVTFWAVSVAALVQLPLVYFLWDAADWGAIGLQGWGALAYLALGPSLAAYVAWYWGLAKGGVVRMAPLQFLMPVVSLTLAVSIFQESLTLPLMASATAIVLGIVISKKTKKS